MVNTGSPICFCRTNAQTPCYFGSVIPSPALHCPCYVRKSKDLT
nr:MAG TPA: hypothetical protein [Caudoviricetes sp.]